MSRRKKKKKLTKGKKKFFIIVACYIVTFVLTSVITASTMAWFNSSTWQSEVLYMGGPVYIYFSDNEEKRTSGAGKLVTEMPPGWDELYPGMNINFEAKAVFEAHAFENTTDTGEAFVQYTSTGTLRAKVRLEVTDPNGNNHDASLIAKEIYDYIWPQLKYNALNDTSNEGIWIFDELNTTLEEDNYFYYVEKNQTGVTSAGDYLLMEVGGKPEQVSVGFLNNTVIQLPPIELTNIHADCRITFTIVFEAVQAFFPYEQEDIGQPYQGTITGDRSDRVTIDDIGLGKPLTVKNSRKIFNESMWTPENGYPQDSY